MFQTQSLLIFSYIVVHLGISSPPLSLPSLVVFVEAEVVRVVVGLTTRRGSRRADAGDTLLSSFELQKE